MEKLEYYAKLFDKLLLGAILRAPNEVEITLKREGVLQITAFLKKSNYKLETITYKEGILNYEFSVERKERIAKKIDKIEDEIKINEESTEKEKLVEKVEEEEKPIDEEPILRLVTEKMIIKIENSYDRVDSICFHYPKAGDIEIELAKKYIIDFIGNIKLYEIRETEIKEKRMIEEELDKEKIKKEKQIEEEKIGEKELLSEEKENNIENDEIEIKIVLEFEEEKKEEEKGMK